MDWNSSYRLDWLDCMLGWNVIVIYGFLYSIWINCRIWRLCINFYNASKFKLLLESNFDTRETVNHVIWVSALYFVIVRWFCLLLQLCVIWNYAFQLNDFNYCWRMLKRYWTWWNYCFWLTGWSYYWEVGCRLESFFNSHVFFSSLYVLRKLGVFDGLSNWFQVK